MPDSLRPIRWLRAAVILAAALMLMPSPAARAVLIQTATGTDNTTAPPDDPGWANVGVRGIGNGVYLGDRWVLSVAHVGSGSIVLEGTTYAAEPGSAVQLTNAGEPGRSALTDLIVYRLTSEPAGLPAVAIAATAPAAGTAVTMIGSGRARGAFTEWSVNETTTPWTWTTVPSGGDYAGYGSTATREMRWGTNAISDAAVWITASDLSPPLDVKSLETVFDELPGTAEAQAVNNDSGGALFAKNGSDWELAGLIFDVRGYSGQPSPAFTAVFGNTTYSVDLAYYRPQIMAIVPEPTGATLTGLAVVATMSWAAMAQRSSRSTANPSRRARATREQ
jgi:hypothetical protein